MFIVTYMNILFQGEKRVYDGVLINLKSVDLVEKIEQRGGELSECVL